MATIVDPFEKKETQLVDPFENKTNQIVDPFEKKEPSKIEDPFEEQVGVGQNIYRTAIGALRDTAQGIVDFSEWLDSPLEIISPKLKGGVVKTEEDGYQFLYGDEYKEAKSKMKSQGVKVIDLPKVSQPTYPGGGFVRDFAGFLIPFSQLKMVSPVSKLGKGTEIVARGAIAEQLAFSPYEQRVSNLVEQYPSLQNPVTE